MPRKQKYNKSKDVDREKEDVRDEKNTKSRSRRSRNTDSRDRSPRTTTADNDPSWYASNEWLLKDAGSLAYSQALGYKASFPIWGESFFVEPEMNVPMAAALELELLPGYAQTPGDPVNLAAFNLYSFVRHANSGHSNYDAPNLMLYMLAMDNIYAAYSHAARAYGLIRLFSERNRSLPKSLFFAMGLDYESFAQNIAQFRYWLNTIAQKVGSFCVPASMTYNLRHMWLFQNVFADGESTKSQHFLFSPAALYVYNERSTTEPPCLIRKRLGRRVLTAGAAPVLMTCDEFMSIIDDAIYRIVASEDLAIMSGDILKAFGPDKVWKLAPIHEDLVVLPVYSEEVLHQIHNASSPCDPSYGYTAEQLAAGDWNAVDDAAVIKEVIDEVTSSSYLTTDLSGVRKYDGSIALLSCGNVINMMKDDVTPGDTMVATRLATAVDQNQIEAFGSELLRRIVICRIGNNGSSIWEEGEVNMIPYAFAVNADGTLGEVNTRCMTYVSSFDFFPQTHLVKRNSNDTRTYVGPVFDIENFTFATHDVLRRMHETALLSEFSVPLMGAWNTKLA